MKLLLNIQFLFFTASLFAQGNEGAEKPRIQTFSRDIDANFLSSYYQQDGNNAAVTGGIGTEKLSDFANVLIVNVPIDSVNSINLYTGLDYYTSASTDNIDNNKSSASSSDTRTFGTLSYDRLNMKRGEAYAAKIGFSSEYDVSSFSAGLTYTKPWNQSNSELSISTQAFFDHWGFYFPKELRGEVSLPTRNRNSYSGIITFSQVLTKRAQLSVSSELIYMNGLLSTPFHRVYFADTNNHDIERLPNSRLKLPLSIRFNYFPIDNLVLRSSYRYYWDDFGIQAHTIELEMPIKIKSIWTIAPFYRYHQQTASDHFAAYGVHQSSTDFYTSDYDLSALNSNKFGIGLKYYPIYGIARSKPFLSSRRFFALKYVELRGAYYQRSTGLNGTVVSLNVAMALK